MQDDFDNFVEDLMAGDSAELKAAPTKQSNAQRFDCGQCGGTGKWSGGRNTRGDLHCYACNGRGYFKTDPRKLKQQRERRRDREAERLRAGLEKFEAENPVMYQELKHAHLLEPSRSDFINSLAAQLFKKGHLSEKQVAAWHRGKETLAKRKAEAEQAKAAQAVTVDLSAIDEMFATAMASGYKKPMYRALGLRIKPGKGGALYVLTEDRMEPGAFGEQPGYEGKIVEGKFHPVRNTADDTPDKLKAIAADPKGEAIRHGQKTGRCSCCGRELTKHASIDAGIGPICAEKWGL